MKKIIVIALLCMCQFAFSQSKGTVTGTVTDKEMNGEPLPFANVFIKGTSIGGTTDMDGKYTIAVPEGKHTLVFSFVGYETVEKSIAVTAGETTTVNQQIGASQGVALKEVQVNATVSKEKETALLLEQKKATVIKESIGAVELAKKAVSNAAGATAKISGVKQSQSSGDIYIRGLGDRYLSTSMNGLPIPSDDVNNKNINLALFSTSIIQSVNIGKTYDTQTYSDQASGNVDVISKVYGKRHYKISLSGGFNDNIISSDKDFRVTENNTDVNFGFIKSKNNLLGQITNQGWDTKKESFPHNYGLSFGMNEKIGNLKIANSISYSKSNSYREGLFKRFKSGDLNQSFDDTETYSRNEIITGHLGLQYKLNRKNKLSYNGLFINNGNQVLYEQGRNGKGTYRDERPTLFTFMRDQNFIQTTVLVNQLMGEHKIGNNKITWAGGINKVLAKEPNRIINILNRHDVQQDKWLFSRTSDFNQRKSSQDIDDIEFNGYLKNELSLGSGEEKPYKLTYGVNFRNKERRFTNQFFGVDVDSDILFGNLDNISAQLTKEKIDSDSNLSTVIRKKDFYNGNQEFYGGFLNFGFTTDSKVSGNIGFRYEYNSIDVLYQVANSGTENGPKFVEKKYKGVYPSANIKFEINEKNFIRLASSITQTLPEFKEIAPFEYNSPSGRISKGDPDIKKSDVYNIDLKYEVFPSLGELFSFTSFFKKIDNPINLVQEISAAGNLVYTNSGDYATVFGLELEGRFNLIENEDEKPILNATGNLSRIWTNQSLIDKYQYNNKKSIELQGASDFIANASVTYSNQKENEFTTTLTGNYTSDNIFALGAQESLVNRNVDFDNEIIEKGFVSLDLVVKKKIGEHLTLNLRGRNLLNPDINQEQLVERYDINSKTLISSTNTLVMSYKKGRDISFGVSYKF